jgi:hypothetical protein
MHRASGHGGGRGAGVICNAPLIGPKGPHRADGYRADLTGEK